MLHLGIAKEAGAPLRQPPARSGRGARTSLQPGGAPRQSIRLYDDGRAKSLRSYSFEEAGRCFDAAFLLLETHADCATDAQVAAGLADYVLYLNCRAQKRDPGRFALTNHGARLARTPAGRGQRL